MHAIPHNRLLIMTFKLPGNQPLSVPNNLSYCGGKPMSEMWGSCDELEERGCLLAELSRWRGVFQLKCSICVKKLTFWHG